MQLRAVTAPRKMALIDDADRLSLAAQNALLKTLEEPPGQALIVLVTASPGGAAADGALALPARAVPAAQRRPGARGAGRERHRSRRSRRARRCRRRQPGPRAAACASPGRTPTSASVERLLADLDPARYGSVLAMSKGLGSTNQKWQPGSTACIVSVPRRRRGSGGTRRRRRARSRRAARRGRRRGASRTLRCRNPNRPLLTEALALAARAHLIRWTPPRHRGRRHRRRRPCRQRPVSHTPDRFTNTTPARCRCAAATASSCR